MRITITSVTCLAFSALLFGCPAEKQAPPPPAEKPKPAEKPAEAPPPAPMGKGKIMGSVAFKGDAPKDEKIDMSKDKKCAEIAKEKMTTDYRIKDGKLADAFVYVAEGLPEGAKYDAPKDAVSLDQHGCRYHPRVFGVMKGQELEIINSDPTLHNIHSMGKNEFNVGMPTQGQKIKKKMKKAEVMTPIKCDVHPWMHAYAGVMEHPFFATSDEAGAFSIADVPAGKYTLVAWHPKLGEQKAMVEVKADGTAEAMFTFEAMKK